MKTNDVIRDASDPRPWKAHGPTVRVVGLCAAVLIGLGVYGLITNPQPLRKILAFNVIGSGVFLLFGAGRVPKMMEDLAKGIKSFKKGLADDEAPKKIEEKQKDQ